MRTVTLAVGERDFRSSTARRVCFGLDVAAEQALGRCDWICYTHLRLAAVQRAVPRILARPYAIFLHDVEAWTPLSDPMRRVMAGAFLRLANSRHTADRVAAANPSAGPIVACPLALPATTGATPPAVTIAIDIGPRPIVIVGRMTATDAYKGHDQLIDAWPRVLAQVPDATLICVGEGDDVERLQAKAAGVGAGHAVRFTGFVDDATRAAIYDRAVALAMPSRREGFGLVYVEAMAAGLPCVGSIHDAAREVIVDGETGFLVDQADTDAIVARLVALLRDETLRVRLGHAGRARYRQLFTYDAFRARLVTAIAAALPVRIRTDRAQQAGVGD